MEWQQNQFDWNHARAFMIVADEGSLSAAGRVMGVSQPTLGRQISLFEAKLNLVLFERVGRGLELTQAGLRLYEHVKQMSHAADQFSLVALGQSNDLQGTVGLSLSQLDAFFKFPELWPKFQEIAPKIRIDLDVNNQISDLKRRQSDIAIRYKRPEEADLIIKKLGEERVFLYGYKDYVESFEDKQPHEINNLRILGFDQTEQLKDYFASCGMTIKEEQIVFLTHNQLVQWQLLKQGNALALLPDHIAARDPNLVPAFSSLCKPMSFDIWLVCHGELHTNPRVRLVFDFLVDHFMKSSAT
ncbi:MAG: LysR family transcriptional regulator [Marinomonas sp.]